MASINTRPNSTFLVILAFAIVYVVWGSTYYFIQVAVISIPPMMLGAMRFIAAGGLLMGWCIARGEKPGNRSQITYSVITGLMMLLGGTRSCHLGGKMASKFTGSYPYFIFTFLVCPAGFP